MDWRFGFILFLASAHCSTISIQPSSASPQPSSQGNAASATQALSQTVGGNSQGMMASSVAASPSSSVASQSSVAPMDPVKPSSFKGSMKMNSTWDAQLANTSSTKFQTQKQSVISAIDTLYTNDPSYVKAEVIGFKQGSVIVETIIKFKSETDIESKMKVFKDAVNSGMVGSLATVADSAITVKTVDGKWSEWENSGECDDDKLKQVRKCVDTAGGGADCVGLLEQIVDCSSAHTFLPSMLITALLVCISAVLYF